jgi:hypothetical protein
MAKQSRPQKMTVRRIMHEYKHGELKSSTGRRVKNPKQAVAIALSEAGVSRKQSPKGTRRRLKEIKRRTPRGQTTTARREVRGRKAPASAKSRSPASSWTKSDLYAEAKRRNIPGRSRMSKRQLARAVGSR